MYCAIQINCTTQVNLRGSQFVSLELPDVFQSIEWTVWSASWDPSEESIMATHVLGPEQSETVGLVLAGTEKNPTKLNFGAIRSIVNDTRYNVEGGCMTGGLQLNWRDAERVQSDQGSETGKHFVSFRFAIEETLFRKVLTLKLTPENQLAMVITYCLSVIATMGTIKTIVQLIIDTLFINKAEKDGVSPPEDVQRRVRVLEEHAITKRKGGQSRRLSALFSPTTIASPGSNVKELSEIELTIRNGETDGGRLFDNPMKRNNSNPVGRRRRSSAPSAFVAPPPSPRRGGAPFTMEERMEQLMRDNIEMKKQLQKLTQKVLGPGTGKTAHGAKTTTTTTQRTKRLSKVMKARRNSHSTQLPKVDPEQVHVDEAAGRKYSVNMNTGESTWLDEEGEGGAEEVQVHVDEATGRRYSVNTNTGESTWLDEEGEGDPNL